MSVINEIRKTKPFGMKRVLLKFAITAICGLIFSLVVIGVFAIVQKKYGELYVNKGGQTIIIEAETSDLETDSTTTSVSREIDGANVQEWQYYLHDLGKELSPALVRVGIKENWGVIISMQQG